MTSRPKSLFISYSCISYFEHVCLKLYIGFTFLSPGKCATQNVKKLSFNIILVHRHVDILWTYMYQGDKLKIMILA